MFHIEDIAPIMGYKAKYQFLPPKDRYFPLTETYSLGGETLYLENQDRDTYIWKAYSENNKIHLKREDLDEVTVLPYEWDGRLRQIDLTFDQNMFPLVTLTINEANYIYWWNKTQYELYSLDIRGYYPKIQMDKPKNTQILESDCILGFNHKGKLYYALQRESFNNTYPVFPENGTHPTASVLWRIGLTKDNRFGFLWR